MRAGGRAGRRAGGPGPDQLCRVPLAPRAPALGARPHGPGRRLLRGARAPPAPPAARVPPSLPPRAPAPPPALPAAPTPRCPPLWACPLSPPDSPPPRAFPETGPHRLGGCGGRGVGRGIDGQRSPGEVVDLRQPGEPEPGRTHSAEADLPWPLGGARGFPAMRSPRFAAPAPCPLHRWDKAGTARRLTQPGQNPAGASTRPRGRPAGAPQVSASWYRGCPLSGYPEESRSWCGQLLWMLERHAREPAPPFSFQSKSQPLPFINGNETAHSSALACDPGLRKFPALQKLGQA